MVMTRSKGLLGIVLGLTLAVIFGLLPGMTMAAWADDPKSMVMDGGQLKKGGDAWNVEDDDNVFGIKKKLTLPAGDYRLDSDIVTGGSILIESGDVTLDLNGHGINASGGFSVITIRGGSLTITDSNPNAVHGYTIPSKSNANGAGLATVHPVKQSGDTEFKGGYITGGKKTSGGIWGGAIAAYNSSSVSVTGCTLIGNHASCGGAINTQDQANISLSGSMIIGNASEDHGGGVYNQGSSGAITLTNCTVQYNYAGKNGGGGVRVYQGSVTVDGGQIVDNACVSGAVGGGISLTNDAPGSSVKLKGNVTINGNKAGDTENNLYLASGSTAVVVDGALTGSTPISVSMQTPGVFTSSGDVSLNDASKFTSEDDQYVVNKNTNGQLELVKLIDVTGVSLDKESIILVTGATEKLTATVTPSDATHPELNWDSSDLSVATVDGAGNVKAVAAGTATITVKADNGTTDTSDDKTATCVVTVTDPVIPVESVTLDTTATTLAVGDELQLKVDVLPADATDADVDWSSSDLSVATVDGVGIVKAVGMGTATVTVKAGSKTATCEITVAGPVEMHRLYNPNSGEHFYTASAYERDAVVAAGWTYEGIGWTAPSVSETPVYRLYNAAVGDHHYTTSEAERDNLVSLGWSDEGRGWYSADEDGVPLYRQYNPNQFANNHNFTASEAERDWLVSLGWNAEGIGWYGVK